MGLLKKIGIGSAAGGAMGGSFAGLIGRARGQAQEQQQLKNDAQLDVADLDSETIYQLGNRETDFRTEGNKAARETDAAIAAQQGLVNSMPAPEGGLRYQAPDDMISAIQESSGRDFGDAAADLRANSAYQADKDKLALGQRAAAGAKSLADMENLKYRAEKQREAFNFRQKMQEEQARKAKRAGTIGKVVGLGGAAVGAFFGGPAGAAAGYQIGNSAGTTLGSNS